jgi:hypothetical protein
MTSEIAKDAIEITMAAIESQVDTIYLCCSSFMLARTEARSGN